MDVCGIVAFSVGVWRHAFDGEDGYMFSSRRGDLCWDSKCSTRVPFDFVAAWWKEGDKALVHMTASSGNWMNGQWKNTMIVM